MVRRFVLSSSALVVVAALLCAPSAFAQTSARDGSRDFDWEIGLWQTSVRVRPPLSTDDVWTTFRGTSNVRALSEHRANTVELSVASGERRIEGVSLRLFNPHTQQWSINFASMRDGVLTAPLYGGFDDGHGVFFGQDSVDGRVVLVRFTISEISPTSAHFEQAYSGDGGQTWVVNWIAVDSRVRP